MTNWIDKKSEAHLEATEWFSFCQEGFPDAVIFANDGSVLDGTYKQVRYIQEQRYQQLAEVARDLYKAVEPMHESCNEDTCLNLIDEGWPSDACLYDFRKQLEELGVEV